MYFASDYYFIIKMLMRSVLAYQNTFPNRTVALSQPGYSAEKKLFKGFFVLILVI